MPVIFNEPLSFLQRIVEYMEYSSILKKASESSDPVKRLEVSFGALYVCVCVCVCVHGHFQLFIYSYPIVFQDSVFENSFPTF